MTGKGFDRGWRCPDCGSREFSLTTYERVSWAVSGDSTELVECEGGTNLVGYRDAWECECGWESHEAPPYDQGASDA